MGVRLPLSMDAQEAADRAVRPLRDALRDVRALSAQIGPGGAGARQTAAEIESRAARALAEPGARR